MATPEKKVKETVKAILKEYGAYFFMPPANGLGRSGIPDLIGCYKGKFFAVECKAGTNTTTPLQDRELDAIRGASGAAIVVNENNVGDVRKMMVWLENL